MGITYDAPSNTITVTGYTEGAPCTAEDLYQANLSGSWGVVTKQGTVQYAFACKLVLGDGSTATWLIDTDKQIVFADGIITGSGQNLIAIYSQATFRLGTAYDATLKSTGAGCSLLFLESSYWYKIREYGGGTLQWYSTHAAAPGAAGRLNLQGTTGTSRVWNCLFNSGFHLWNCTGNYDVYNLTVTDCYFGRTELSGTHNRISVFHGAYHFYAESFGGYTLTNLVGRDATAFGIRMSSVTTGHIYLVDPDLDLWTIYWTGTSTKNLYRQHRVNVLVTEDDGTPIESATAQLLDNAGATMFSVATGAGGTIAEQTVTRGYFDQAHGNTLQDAGPFTLTITKAGYMPYVHSGLVLDAPLALRLSLRTQLSGDAAEEDVVAGKTFYKDDADAKLTGALHPITDALPFAAEVASPSVLTAVAATAIEVEVDA